MSERRKTIVKERSASRMDLEPKSQSRTELMAADPKSMSRGLLDRKSQTKRAGDMRSPKSMTSLRRNSSKGKFGSWKSSMSLFSMDSKSSTWKAIDRATKSTTTMFDPNLDPNSPEGIKAAEKEQKRQLKIRKLYRQSQLDRTNQYAVSLYESIKPAFLFGYWTGRFPVITTRTHDGTYSFQFKMKSVSGVHFVISSILVTIVFLIICVQTIDYLRYVDEHDMGTEDKMVRFHRKIIYNRYIMDAVFNWSNLVQCTAVSICIWSRRDYVPQYYRFWTEGVQTMKMDVTIELENLMWRHVIGFVVSVVVYVALMAIPIGTARGSGTVVGYQVLSVFDPDFFTRDYKSGSLEALVPVQILGGFLFVTTWVWSKPYVLLMSMQFRFLGNAITKWNGRLYVALLKGDKETEEAINTARTSTALLFKDFSVILDLIRATDTLFKNIMEFYVGCSIISIVLETYFTIRGVIGTSHNNATYFERGHDYTRGLIIIVNSMVCMVLFLTSASDVGHEGFAGFEILRRRTMIGQRRDDELNFLLSLYAIYTAPDGVDIRGAHYVIFNREFVMGVCGIFFTYIIFATQFGLTFDYSGDVGSDGVAVNRSVIGYFIHALEPPTAWQHRRSVCDCIYSNDYKYPSEYHRDVSARAYCNRELRRLNYSIYW